MILKRFFSSHKGSSFVSANCLICYTCTSNVSWEDCNSNVIKKDCHQPFCTTSEMKCSAGNCYSNYTIFYKRCGNRNNEDELCNPVDQEPSCPAHMVPAEIWNLCCPKNYCNSGPLSRISGLLTGMPFLLALLVFLP